MDRRDVLAFELLDFFAELLFVLNSLLQIELSLHASSDISRTTVAVDSVMSAARLFGLGSEITLGRQLAFSMHLAQVVHVSIRLISAPLNRVSS